MASPSTYAVSFFFPSFQITVATASTNRFTNEENISYTVLLAHFVSFLPFALSPSSIVVLFFKPRVCSQCTEH